MTYGQSVKLPRPAEVLQAPLNGGVRVRQLTAHADDIADRVHLLGGELIEQAVRHITSKHYEIGWTKEKISGLDYFVYQSSAFEMPRVYLRGQLLGEGTTSIVYQVHLLNTGETAAIKLEKLKDTIPYLFETLIFLNPDHSKQVGIQRAPIYPKPCRFVGPSGVEMALIEEKCKGDLYQNPPVDAKEFNKFLSDITAGFLHFYRYLNHGDIKPENILRIGDEYLLSDWGSSRKYAEKRVCLMESRERFMVQSQGMDEAEKAALALKYVKCISDTYTPAYCREEDWALLLKAFMDGDLKKYSQIEHSRDVFALGATLIAAIDPKGYYNQNIWRRIVRKGGQMSAEGMVCLNVEQVLQLKVRGLSDEQIEMVDKMLRDSDKRPTPKEIYNVFHKNSGPVLGSKAPSLPTIPEEEFPEETNEEMAQPSEVPKAALAPQAPAALPTIREEEKPEKTKEGLAQPIEPISAARAPEAVEILTSPLPPLAETGNPAFENELLASPRLEPPKVGFFSKILSLF